MRCIIYFIGLCIVSVPVQPSDQFHAIAVTYTCETLATLFSFFPYSVQEWENVVNRYDQHGNTPLHYIVQQGDVKKIVLFLLYGADVHAKNLAGKTPLHSACELPTQAMMPYEKLYNTLDILLAAGANANARDNEGNSPLHYAAQGASAHIINRLCQAGADVDIINKMGQLPLHKACDGTTSDDTIYKVAAVRSIISRSHCYMVPDNQCDTPLHYALYHGLLKITHELLYQQPDLFFENINQVMPISLIYQYIKNVNCDSLANSDNALHIGETLIKDARVVVDSRFWDALLQTALRVQNPQLTMHILRAGANPDAGVDTLQRIITIVGNGANIKVRLNRLLELGLSPEKLQRIYDRSMSRQKRSVTAVRDALHSISVGDVPIKNCNNNPAALLNVLQIAIGQGEYAFAKRIITSSAYYISDYVRKQVLLNALDMRMRCRGSSAALDDCISSVATHSMIREVIENVVLSGSSANKVASWRTLMGIALAYPHHVKTYAHHVVRQFGSNIERICDLVSQDKDEKDIISDIAHDMIHTPEDCSLWEVAFMLKQYWSHIPVYYDNNGNNICHSCAHHRKWVVFLPDLWSDSRFSDLMHQSNFDGNMPIQEALQQGNITYLRRWSLYNELVHNHGYTEHEARNYMNTITLEKHLSDYPMIHGRIQ